MKKICCTSVLIGFLTALLSFSAVAMEYKHTLENKKMTFSWSYDDENLYVKISGKTKSWVGIGFNPEKAMSGANIILGYVKKGKLNIEDHYGNRKTGHKSDKALGGTDDFKDAVGTEEKGVTTISFTLPLKLSEKWDNAKKPIDPEGKTLVMLALGKRGDNFSSLHEYRWMYEVNLATGESKKLR